MSELAQQVSTPERTVEAVTLEIRTLHRQALQMLLGYAIEIGRRLVEVKALLPHGEWGNYLQREVEYSQSTAQNFMRIFEEYGASQQSIFGPEAKSQTLGNLPYTKALILLALPNEERETFIENNDVDGMSTRELKEAIRERDAAAGKAESLARQLAQQQQDMEKQQAEYRRALEEEKEKASVLAEEADREVLQLKEQLRELETRPESVAVESVADEAAVQAAADTARREAEEQLAAKIQKAKKAQEKAEQAKQKAEQDLAALKVSQEEQAAIAAREKQAVAEQVQDLQKKLAVASSSEVVIFKLHFDQCQESINKMSECIAKMRGAGETGGADKLTNALSALLNTYLGALDGEEA